MIHTDSSRIRRTRPVCKRQRKKEGEQDESLSHLEPIPKAGKSRLKFCPKCGSADVFFASGLPQLGSLWDCRDCGYRGALIIQDGDLAAKLKEEYAKKASSR